MEGYQVRLLPGKNIGRDVYNRVKGDKALYVTDVFNYLRSLEATRESFSDRIRMVLHVFDLLERDFAAKHGSANNPMPEGYVATFNKLILNLMTGK